MAESPQAALRVPRGLWGSYQLLPLLPLAAGDSHEHTQDVCGLTETSRARASLQMDGRDARGWSSSWPGRAVTGTAGTVLGWLQARVGGEGAGPALGLLLSTSARHGGTGSSGLSMCQGCTEQVKVPAVPSGVLLASLPPHIP